jgi:hypothetical protein
MVQKLALCRSAPSLKNGVDVSQHDVLMQLNVSRKRVKNQVEYFPKNILIFERLILIQKSKLLDILTEI